MAYFNYYITIIGKFDNLVMFIIQINPKPWLCYKINFTFLYRIYFVSYSGSSKTLKHVCAVGKLFVFECRWIKKFKLFNPSIGTRSVPVTKARKLLQSF
jgi:hypothetical protein